MRRIVYGDDQLIDLTMYKLPLILQDLRQRLQAVIGLVESWAMCAGQLHRYGASLSTCRPRETVALAEFWAVGKFLTSALREAFLPGQPGGWVERIVTGLHSRYSGALAQPQGGYPFYKESLTSQEARLVDELLFMRACVTGDWDTHARITSITRLDGRTIYVLDGQGRSVRNYGLRDVLREEALWYEAFQHQQDCTIQEQKLQHGRNRWVNFAGLTPLVKPSFKPETPIPATEDALMEKLSSVDGGVAGPSAGAGPAPPTAEGSGTAYDGQDYYGDGWATSADLHSVREELDSGHADIYQKIEAMDQRLEKIEALVLQLHRKFFPGGVGVQSPPPPPPAETRPPAAPAAGSAAAPVQMEQ